MTITIKTTGMACAHCEKRVHDLLMKIDGVESVQASAKTGLVTVQSKDHVTPAMLKEAILDAGYEVTE